MKYLIGLFGGIAVTTIIHFLLINGLKSATFMTPEHLNGYTHTLSIIFICFVVSGALMQVLYWMKIDILRIIVLLGTFSLATAFAGNDLVNFIGVPLAGYSSFAISLPTGPNNPDQFLMGRSTHRLTRLSYFDSSRLHHGVRPHHQQESPQCGKDRTGSEQTERGGRDV